MCRRGSLSILEASWKTRQRMKSQLETLQRPTETEEDIFFPLLPAICQHYLCLLIFPGSHPLFGCICCVSIYSSNYTEFNIMRNRWWFERKSFYVCRTTRLSFQSFWWIHENPERKVISKRSKWGEFISQLNTITILVLIRNVLLFYMYKDSIRSQI